MPMLIDPDERQFLLGAIPDPSLQTAAGWLPDVFVPSESMM